MPLANTTANTTTSTVLEAQLSNGNHVFSVPATSITTPDHQRTPPVILDQSATSYEDTDSFVDEDFDESICLFCDAQNANLTDNLTHMSSSHGLHIDQANLLVDLGNLLSYCHLVIHRYHECLYCGKQWRSLKSVRQHMIAKGHCKYDILSEDSEFKEFYSSSTTETKARFLSKRSISSEELQHRLRTRSRRTRETRSEDRQIEGRVDLVSTTPQQALLISDSSRPESVQDEIDYTVLVSDTSRRAQRHNDFINRQLANLRAEDRRSLAMFPASQQRSILATYRTQLANASREAQTQRTRLESAGNHFNRLSSYRLVRMPPHKGNVFSLNR